MKFKPMDAARECGVNVNTIRNWCTEYGEFLSSGAQVQEGTRALSERDVEVLKHIGRLRKDGLKKPQIVLRLRETHFGEIEQPPAEQTENPITVQEIPQAQETTLLVLRTMNDFSQRLETVEKRNRDYVIAFIVGIVVGVLLMFVFILLTWYVQSL